MSTGQNEMARLSYGYGRWDGPYWFIGPEQGMGSHELDLGLRVKAWQKLGRRELNDCRAFHREIKGERWHFKTPRVRLQTTWRPLLLLLMTYLGRPTNREALRSYQRERWGYLDGETCGIELSGLASPTMKDTQDTGVFLNERIQSIKERIRTFRPTLVLMYGLENRA